MTYPSSGQKDAQWTAIGALGGTGGYLVNNITSALATAQINTAVAANFLTPAPSWMLHGVDPSNAVPASFMNIYNHMLTVDSSFRI